MKKTDTISTRYIIDSHWFDINTKEKLSINGTNGKFIAVTYEDRSIDIHTPDYCDKFLVPLTKSVEVLYDTSTDTTYSSIRRGKTQFRENLAKEFSSELVGLPITNETIKTIKNSIEAQLQGIASEVEVEHVPGTNTVDISFKPIPQSIPFIEFNGDILLDYKKPDEE